MSLDITHLQAHEAEMAVLGSVLIRKEAMDEIADMLEPRDFSSDTHENIWRCMKSIHKTNISVDLVTLSTMLQRMELLERVGNVKYISELANFTPNYLNIKEYARIVQSRSYRKRAYEAGQKLMDLSINDNSEADEDFFDAIERPILAIRPNTSGDMRHISETRKEYFDYLATADDFIYSGFSSFDEWMGGYGRGWLVIKAGRPSVGKTAKVLQEAIAIARQNVGEVLIWSQEMKRNQLLNRMLPSVTGVNGIRIRKKILEPYELDKLHKGYDELEKLPLHIEDAKNVTIEEVRSTARQMKRKHGKLAAIIVDYLTIMRIVQQKGETRSQAVGYVTRTAKQIALEMDCPFIMLAQLSREGKDEPKLEHLRDSGEIEQDADVVEFLWHNPDETSNDGKVIQCIIAKGRDIGVNQFKYLFKGWIQKYEEMKT